MSPKVPDPIRLLLACLFFIAGVYSGQIILFITTVFLLTPRSLSDVANVKPHQWVILVVVLSVFIWPLPDLSDDYHRYLFEGHAQNQGYSPYLYNPVSLYDTLDHPSSGKVNHHELTAIYPPLAQYIFRFADLISTSVYGWKALTLLCLLPLFFLLPSKRVLFILLSPALLIEGIWNSHIDILAVAPTVWLVHSLQKERPVRTGIALAVLITIKIIPVLFLPVCFLHLKAQKRIHFLGALAGSIILIYAPWYSHLPELFASFIKFSREWYFNNPFFHLLRLTGLEQSARPILAGLLLTSLAVIYLVKRPATWKLLAVWIAVIIFSPTVHPWYLIWLVPLTAFNPSNLLRANYAYLIVSISYLVLIPYRSEGIWREDPIWLVPEWILLLTCFWLMLRNGNANEIAPANHQNA